MVSFNKRKVAARSILILYAFITIVFPLAHRDYVPLESGNTIIPVNSLHHPLDADNDLGCPAHNFAQSTHGTAVVAQNFSSSERISIIKVGHRDRLFSAQLSNLSARAPPQA